MRLIAYPLFLLVLASCSGSTPPATTTVAAPAASDGPSRAEEVEKPQCDAGDLDACFRLSAAYRFGYGETPIDPAKALPLLKAGCEKKHPGSCNDLGAMYGEGEAVAVDSKKAAELYELACGLDDALACANLAAFLMEGTGVDKSPQRAVEMYEKACAMGEQSGCRDLGFAYLGYGLPEDFDKAHAILEKSCEEAKFGQSCADLGFMYVKGMGVPVDKEKGSTLMKRGCTLGYDRACGFR